MGVEIEKKYVVYRLNSVMNSKKHLALEEVEFKGLKTNWFDTEEDAIQALIEDKKTYQDFVIIKKTRIIS